MSRQQQSQNNKCSRCGADLEKIDIAATGPAHGTKRLVVICTKRCGYQRDAARKAGGW